jgi:hypothetical protein
MDLIYLWYKIVQLICDLLSTYPQLFLHSLRLVAEYPALPIFSIGGRGVVLERIGQLLHSAVPNHAREVLPA